MIICNNSANDRFVPGTVQQCVCVCACVRVRVCACVRVGALVVQLVESWDYNPEDTGSNPRAGGKNITSTPAHPSVKWVPGLVLGSKVHWLCLIDH